MNAPEIPPKPNDDARAPDKGSQDVDVNYDILRDDHIIQTVDVLRQRIGDRFPNSGLSRLCTQLLEVSKQASERSEWIGRRITSLRWSGYLLAVLLFSVIAGVIVEMVLLVGVSARDLGFADLIQTVDAGISAMIFISAAIYFLINLERRIKRDRALKALHELRSLAHIVDMHQLTKDPERVMPSWQGTKNSPPSTMTPLELNRYLDYCTEMLSLIGKIAALYIVRFDDPVAVAAASEVEQLCTGLSRKIWQKIMLVQTL